jgi:LysM repeat protein
MGDSIDGIDASELTLPGHDIYQPNTDNSSVAVGPAGVTLIDGQYTFANPTTAVGVADDQLDAQDDKQYAADLQTDINKATTFTNALPTSTKAEQATKATDEAVLAEWNKAEYGANATVQGYSQAAAAGQNYINEQQAAAAAAAAPPATVAPPTTPISPAPTGGTMTDPTSTAAPTGTTATAPAPAPTTTTTTTVTPGSVTVLGETIQDPTTAAGVQADQAKAESYAEDAKKDQSLINNDEQEINGGSPNSAALRSQIGGLQVNISHDQAYENAYSQAAQGGNEYIAKEEAAATEAAAAGGSTSTNGSTSTSTSSDTTGTAASTSPGRVITAPVTEGGSSTPIPPAVTPPFAGSTSSSSSSSSDLTEADAKGAALNKDLNDPSGLTPQGTIDAGLQTGADNQQVTAYADAEGDKTIIVHSGDTFTGIAQNNGVSEAKLASANPQIANKNLIHPGQEIIIPGGSATQTQNSGSAGGGSSSSADDTGTITVDGKKYTGKKVAGGAILTADGNTYYPNGEVVTKAVDYSIGSGQNDLAKSPENSVLSKIKTLTNPFSGRNKS